MNFWNYSTCVYGEHIWLQTTWHTWKGQYLQWKPKCLFSVFHLVFVEELLILHGQLFPLPCITTSISVQHYMHKDDSVAVTTVSPSPALDWALYSVGVLEHWNVNCTLTLYTGLCRAVFECWALTNRLCNSIYDKGIYKGIAKKDERRRSKLIRARNHDFSLAEPEIKAWKGYFQDWAQDLGLQ